MKKFKLELNDQDITQKGIAAIINFYQAIATEQLQFDNVYAFVTGIDSPFLNVVLDARAYKKNSSILIKEMTNFFDQYQIPWAWFVVPGDYKNDLPTHGFSVLEEVPAMYFDLSNKISMIKIDSLEIHEVSKNDNLKMWIQPINEGFQVKENDDRYRKLNVAILKKHPDNFRHFVAYYKNNLAAAGTLFLSEDTTMIHNLATKTMYAKRGIGTALTLHMMEQAKSAGFKHCFLDSSEDAFNLYQKIGFKVYSTTTVYKKP